MNPYIVNLFHNSIMKHLEARLIEMTRGEPAPERRRLRRIIHLAFHARRRRVQKKNMQRVEAYLQGIITGRRPSPPVFMASSWELMQGWTDHIGAPQPATKWWVQSPHMDALRAALIANYTPAIRPEPITGAAEPAGTWWARHPFSAGAGGPEFRAATEEELLELKRTAAATRGTRSAPPLEAHFYLVNADASVPADAEFRYTFSAEAAQPIKPKGESNEENQRIARFDG